jgi:hypothetical protein
MTPTTYEIHVRGHLPKWLGAELSDATAIEASPETVLLTPRIDQTGLHEMLARLRDLGIELVEIRRTAGWLRGDAEANIAQQRQNSDLDSYEIRVHGLLGPLLLSAVPHVAAQPVPRHTLLVTDGSNGRDLVEIMHLISTALEVVSVRATASAVTGPTVCGRTPQARPAG